MRLIIFFTYNKWQKVDWLPLKRNLEEVLARERYLQEDTRKNLLWQL
jgi:hypothetical protein